MKYEMHVRIYRGKFPNHYCADAGLEAVFETEQVGEAIQKTFPRALSLKRLGGYDSVMFWLIDEENVTVYQGEV